MPELVEVEITGKVFGYRKDGEDLIAAQGRIALAAEQRINAVHDLRAHLSVLRFACRWCTQGYKPIRSSVSEAFMVHTDTPVGRVVCFRYQ